MATLFLIAIMASALFITATKKIIVRSPLIICVSHAAEAVPNSQLHSTFLSQPPHLLQSPFVNTS